MFLPAVNVSFQRKKIHPHSALCFWQEIMDYLVESKGTLYDIRYKKGEYENGQSRGIAEKFR